MNSKPSKNNAENTPHLDDHWLERVAKGFANARRIRILQLLEKEPELTLEDVCDRLMIDTSNGYEHLRKLEIAGLVEKRRQDNRAHHRLTARGKQALAYLRTVR